MPGIGGGGGEPPGGGGGGGGGGDAPAPAEDPARAGAGRPFLDAVAAACLSDASSALGSFLGSASAWLPVVVPGAEARS